MSSGMSAVVTSSESTLNSETVGGVGTPTLNSTTGSEGNEAGGGVEVFKDEAISSKAFLVESPSLKVPGSAEGEGCFKMEMISSTACNKYSSVVIVGIGMSCGKNVTVSVTFSVLVFGKKALILR